MKNITNNSSSHNRLAFIWIMISVIAESVVVLIIDWGGTNKFPFVFAAISNLFGFLIFLFIMISLRPKLFSKKVLRAVFRSTQDSSRTNLLIVLCIELAC